MKLLIEWELFPFRFTAKSVDGDYGPDDEVLDRLAVIQQIGDEIRMNLNEALVSVAASDAQVNRGLVEIRAQLDKQTRLIEELKTTPLTAEQEKIVTDLAATSTAIDDVVPAEVPPVDPNAPPVDPNAPIQEHRKAGGTGSGVTHGKGK